MPNITTPEEFVKNSYDYIVVGGGTAGLVIAARLSENPNVTIGILEAGQSQLNDPLIDGPSLFTQLWDKPEYDWCYKTVPQKGTNFRVHGWARGKVLGGSSAINYNMFSMASRQDIDNWEALGNKGWGFDDLAPYYRKFETYNPPSKTLASKIRNHYDTSLRGTNGPIQVSFCEADFAWNQDVWPKLCNEAGYPVPKDPRSGSAIGGFNQLTTVDPKSMRRSYSAREYYEPNENRPNLSLLTNALVSKIELNKNTCSDVMATGVAFIVNGKSHTVKVNKEVIVCGGTVNSPQILELSGIGSSSVLSKAGVELIVENCGVGENLNDHTASVVTLQIKKEYPTAEVIMRDPDVAQRAMEDYVKNKTGPFTNSPTTTSFASLRLIDPELSEPEKHIQSLMSEYAKKKPDRDPAGRDVLLASQLMDQKEAASQFVMLTTGCDISKLKTPSQLFNHDVPGNWITMASCSTRSLSRGSIHITSSDPLQHPNIDPEYFSHPLDLDIAARGILHCLKLTNYEPLRSIMQRNPDSSLIAHPVFGKLPTTLDEAKEAAMQNTVTEYHPVGTCAMLPTEKGGVVDGKLMVYGTKNVRVVDASIFPTQVQGNILSLIYAVAEKASDIIKEDGKVMILKQ